MHGPIDLSSWQTVLSTLLGIAVFSLVAIGIRLLVMQAIQQRRERENRQINERLRTLIAAYKTLGGSFTGNLAVDPTHWRDARTKAQRHDVPTEGASPTWSHAEAPPAMPNFDRRRRVRDAVEAALSDIILLGTEEQVRLAVAAAHDMAAGRQIETAALVVSLRRFIRQVLDLEPVPPELVVPKQGPSRLGSPAGRGGNQERGRGRGGAGSGGGLGAIGAAGGTGLGRGFDDEVHGPEGRAQSG